MVRGVFGASGFRASVGDNDGNNRHCRNDSSHALPRKIDEIVGESGIIYGSELIPREISASQEPGRIHQDFHARSDGTRNAGRTGDHTVTDNAGRTVHVQAQNYTSHDNQPSHSGWSMRSTYHPSDYTQFTLDIAPVDIQVTPEEQYRLADNEPEKIRQLLGMYRFTVPSQRSREFVRQAKFMEDYESDDGVVDVSFHAFYPTYSDMTIRQLKNYFAWRTKVRHGEYTLTSTSCAFVYVYELLNGIGAGNTENAYAKIREFQRQYVDHYDLSMNRYINQWLKDLVVYADLQGEPLQEQFGTLIADDQPYAALANPHDFSDSAVADAVTALGSYHAEKSPLSKRMSTDDHADHDPGELGNAGINDNTSDSADKPIERRNDVGERSERTLTLYDRAVASAWRAVATSHAMAKSYFHARVATWQKTPVTLFQRAVFYDREKVDHPDLIRKVRIDPVREFVREDGRWHEGSYQAVTGQRSYINGFSHEVDRIGRQVWHVGRTLKPRGFFPPYTQLITQVLTELKRQTDREAWEVTHPPVHVDLSKLASIRLAAADTRESLLTEEERDAEVEERKAEVEEREAEVSRETSPLTPEHTDSIEAKSIPAELTEQGNPTGEPIEGELATTLPAAGNSYGETPTLTDAEVFLLRSLVEHQPTNEWKPKLLERHILPSIVADSINDKLFDLVGDSVLETDEHGNPMLIDDYEPDIQEYLAEIEDDNDE